MKNAVFAIIVNSMGNVLCTTRPEDKEHPFGLPGGKVDPGETLADALRRECKEEGVNIDQCDVRNVHQSVVDGMKVFWYTVSGRYVPLMEYKEKHRGIEIEFMTVEEVANSGYGNEFLADMLVPE